MVAMKRANMSGSAPVGRSMSQISVDETMTTSLDGYEGSLCWFKTTPEDNIGESL